MAEESKITAVSPKETGLLVPDFVIERKSCPEGSYGTIDPPEGAPVKEPLVKFERDQTVRSLPHTENC